MEDTQYRSAGDGVGAECSIPCITGVAIGVTVDIVHPTPVGVKNDGLALRRARTSRRTLLDGERGVSLSSDRTGLLAVNDSKESESYESRRAEHVEQGSRVIDCEACCLTDEDLAPCLRPLYTLATVW